jgi:hypothetical protein
LIQEDYDAAKSDRKMGKRFLPHAMIRLVMTNLIQTQLCSKSHWVTNYFFYGLFFGGWCLRRVKFLRASTNSSID